MTLRKSVTKLTGALEDVKAQDIRVLDVRKLTTITDMMIIATGRTNRQVKAMADRILETAGEIKMEVLGMEGQQEGEWILIDLGDAVVHLMQPAIRDYYQLEKLWSQEGMQPSASPG